MPFFYVCNSQASQTVMDSNKSTAHFEIPHLSAQQGGLWECRVSTNGGQDSRKFNVTIKGKSFKYEQTGKYCILCCDHFQNADALNEISIDLHFKIYFCVFSVPPVPTTAPKLLEKRSKQLLVMAVDSHRGDGPISSTRVLYKPVENGDSWSSIIGKISFKGAIWLAFITESSINQHIVRLDKVSYRV